MRVATLVAFVILMACSPAAGPAASVSHTTTACLLPVYWSEQAAPRVHAAFVGVPDGATKEVGIIPQLQFSNAATYDTALRKWIGAHPRSLSPDRTRYSYSTVDASHTEIHVVELASGSDRTVYSGASAFVVNNFAADSIFLVGAARAKEGVFENLFRLDPAGGTPQLVPGSERHMYQWGWVLVDDGAAWGIDYRVDGNTYLYSVLRLDLATSSVTQWLEGPPDRLIWPLGVDAMHRIYIGDGQSLLRAGPAMQGSSLAGTETIAAGDGVGVGGGFARDALGVWFAGQGRVWRYVDDQTPKAFRVGPATATIFPAGPCT